MLKKDLLTLQETDLYSLSMFMLYKLIDIPEYSAIGELPYILDKKNLLRLCQYFGGRTIKIPTLSDLEFLMQALLLYQHVNFDSIPYEDALKLIGYESKDLRQVKSIYTKLCKVLDEYEFKPRDNY